MPLIQLSISDGSWRRLKDSWAGQCTAAQEDFSIYAQGAFMVLDQLAAQPEPNAGIFAVQNGDDPPDLICQANHTPLPGHPDPVLRIRMVTVSPAIDFGQHEPSRYLDVLGDLFTGIVELSQRDMPAREIKLHLRSPEDFNFFRVAARHLSQLRWFKSVAMHGAWLHVIKSTN